MLQLIPPYYLIVNKSHHVGKKMASTSLPPFEPPSLYL